MDLVNSLYVSGTLFAEATGPGGLSQVDWLWVALRFAHFVASFVLVGGAMYLSWVLAPALQRHESAEDAVKIITHGRKRWAMAVGISALFLIGTGLYSFIKTIGIYEVSRPWYHMLFGIKFLLAMVVFFLASVLAGRTALAEKFRSKLSFWLGAIVWLSLAILLLATVLRFLPKKEKPKLASVTPATATAQLDATQLDAAQ